MGTESVGKSQGAALWGWITERFPIDEMLREHVTEYWTPKNFNFWYIFGVTAISSGTSWVRACRPLRCASRRSPRVWMRLTGSAPRPSE